MSISWWNYGIFDESIMQLTLSDGDFEDQQRAEIGKKRQSYRNIRQVIVV